MKTIAGCSLVGTMLVCAPAFADAQLVKDKQCLQCHAIGEDTVGPSFKKIAGFWKGKENAEKTLVATIRKGSVAGGGLHWSMKAQMPSDAERPLVSEDEAKRIVKWIMSQ